MWTQVPIPWLPVRLGTPTLSVHQVLSVSRSLPCIYSIWAWEGQVCLKAKSFSLLLPGSWSTSVPQFMVINETEKVHVMFGARSLLLCGTRSEIPEESGFWESVVRLPTERLDLDGSHATLSDGFRLSIQTFGFLSTLIPNFVKLLKVYCG